MAGSITRSVNCLSFVIFPQFQQGNDIVEAVGFQGLERGKIFQERCNGPGVFTACAVIVHGQSMHRAIFNLNLTFASGTAETARRHGWRFTPRIRFPLGESLGDVENQRDAGGAAFWKGQSIVPETDPVSVFIEWAPAFLSDAKENIGDVHSH